MARGRALMVQGTASSVGKSLLVTALCRHFSRAGLRVAPFKAQNMSLNSAVTPDGHEIGRAQAVQAEACGIPARVEMNPILLKPEAGHRAQVVLLGKPLSRMAARDYYARHEEMKQVVARSLQVLQDEYDLVVIEGAGSAAEVNLKDRDLVNMYVARLADAPVLLVGDIDRGGVFASLIGTLSLLEDDERARVAALIVNKFRGDPRLFEDGVRFLEERTEKPVLGVVPHVADLRIADEDSLGLDGPRSGGGQAGAIAVSVLRLPHISNYDDVLPLERDSRFDLRFVENLAPTDDPDLLVIPGSKCTIADLQWLRDTGAAARIAERAARGRAVLGVCGGCQMLGHAIEDPYGVESIQDPHGVESNQDPYGVESVDGGPGGVPGRASGLGLLPLWTEYARDKTTADVRALPAAASFLTQEVPEGQALRGYEIHMGQMHATSDGTSPPFLIEARNGEACRVPDGACQGSVVGTMLHGILDNASVRSSLVASLAGDRQLIVAPEDGAPRPEAELDRLEREVSAALDLDALWHIVGLERPA